jgi:hypothetical protein
MATGNFFANAPATVKHRATFGMARGCGPGKAKKIRRY